MAILERRIQSVRKEKEYWEWEKKWEAVEKRLGGFPTKKHYQLISGRDDSGTMVWEREWESFSVAEAAYNRMYEDAEAKNLFSSALGIIESERIEYYFVM